MKKYHIINQISKCKPQLLIRTKLKTSENLARKQIKAKQVKGGKSHPTGAK